MILIAIPVSILGIFGNLVVIFILSFKIKKTRFTVYVLNITIADLGILIYLYIYFMLFLQPSPVNASVSYIIELIYAVGYNCSFYILTALCFERYLSVFFFTWYQCHRPEHLSFFLVITLWIFSGLVSLLEYFACYPRFYIYLDENTLQCRIINLFQIFLEFLIFIPIMVFYTLAIFIRMQKKNQQTPPAKLDISITATVVLFLVFDVSVKIFNAIEFWFDAVHVPTFSVAVLFDSISSSVNPYVYFIIGGFLKRSFDPLEVFLERALEDDGTTVEGT
ncbi:proto-oncogene Mas [Protobothrops mucrosquamatus]|uniref:proto-oncogene Mas n=1 Tax=Protobothrops mucrosquamatus TaxID=103944 RepID=UPI0010FAF088|nr:proto-oncogene Mas [Protobothrops mucrosquamatus]